MFLSPRGRERRAGRRGEDGMCRGADPGRAGEGQPGSRGGLGAHHPVLQYRRGRGTQTLAVLGEVAQDSRISILEAQR